MQEDKNSNFKVVVLGRKDSGKTALCTRFVEGTFSEEYPDEPLEGYEIWKKSIQLDNAPAELILLDMVHDLPEAILRSNLRHTSLIILMGDPEDYLCFLSPDIPVIFVSSRADEVSTIPWEKRKVSFQSLAEKYHLQKFFRVKTSAKTGEGFDELHQCVMRALSKNPSLSLKATFLGERKIGKSTLLKEWCGVDTEVKPTLGVEFFEKTIEIQGVVFDIQCWDVSGQERESPILSDYLNHSDLFFLLWSAENPASFQTLRIYLDKLREKGYLNDDVPIIFVCCSNRVDDNYLKTCAADLHQWVTLAPENFGIIKESELQRMVQKLLPRFIPVKTILKEKSIMQAQEERSKHPAKVFFLGESKAGKTAVFERMTKNTFNGNGYEKTVAVNVGDKNNVRLFDVAGDIQSRLLFQKEREHTDLFCVMWDVSQPHTLEGLLDLVSPIDPKIPLVFVGCKSDLLRGEKKEHVARIHEFLRATHRMYVFVFTSAKNNEGFDKLSTKIGALLKLSSGAEPEAAVSAVIYDGRTLSRSGSPYEQLLCAANETVVRLDCRNVPVHVYLEGEIFVLSHDPRKYLQLVREKTFNEKEIPPVIFVRTPNEKNNFQALATHFALKKFAVVDEWELDDVMVDMVSFVLAQKAWRDLEQTGYEKGIANTRLVRFEELKLCVKKAKSVGVMSRDDQLWLLLHWLSIGEDKESDVSDFIQKGLILALSLKGDFKVVIKKTELYQYVQTHAKKLENVSTFLTELSKQEGFKSPLYRLFSTDAAPNKMREIIHNARQELTRVIESRAVAELN